MKVLLVGCGNIGEILLKQWLHEEVMVVQPSLRSRSAFAQHHSIQFVNRVESIPPHFNEELIVLAVKPQNLKAIAAPLETRNPEAVVVSVLAATPLIRLAHLLPRHPHLIRLMPNVGLKTGNSINLVFAGPSTNASARDFFYETFLPFGPVIFLEDEEQLDQLTPLFGSGPAYFFLLANLLLQEAKRAGLEESTAKKLVDQLLIGTASLTQENLSYEEAIQSVASKKGVTEAALKVMEPKMQEAITSALEAALLRVKELSYESCN